jgi:signal transduction histidine kinase
MIVPAKRRLSLIFAAVLIGFNALILAGFFLYFHESLLIALRQHMEEEIQTELLPHYRRSDPREIGALSDTDRFQILDRSGAVRVGTSNSADFHPRLNRALLAAAFTGTEGYERLTVNGQPYMIAYRPLDSGHVLRAAGPMELLVRNERIFLAGALMALPVLFLLSFAISRYLLNQAMQPIAEVFTYQETFSSSVTHELMSPLTSLRGNLEVALRRPREPGEYEETLHLALGEVTRIIDLLGDLSLLACSRRKPLELFRERVSLGALLDHRAGQLARRAAERGIRLQWQQDSPAWCAGDVALVRRTLDNLLDNALKYTPAGGTVSIRLGNQGEWAVLEMANAVAAQPIGVAEQLFEPFERGNQAGGPVPGKGLGLYISRYIARSHGGDLRIDPAREGRFAIVLSLPACAPAGAAAA